MYVPEAKVGDYAMVHVGFALNLLDEAEAQETLALLDQMDLLGNVLDAHEDQPVDGEITG
jgi:hydrogenase expression/formation protein HypC